MRISINQEACTGHGRCYSLSPELFQPDDEGRGVLLSEEVPAGLEDKARLAEGSCPERAIVIEV